MNNSQPLKGQTQDEFSRIFTIRNNTDHDLLSQQVNFNNKPSVHLDEQENAFNHDAQFGCQDEPSYSLESSSRSADAKSRIQCSPRLPPPIRLQLSSQRQETKVSLNGWSNNVWKKNPLRIMTLVVKFVISLLTNSEKFKFTFINMRQFTAIDDKSSVYQFYVQNKLIREKFRMNLKKKCLKRIQSTWLFQCFKSILDAFLQKIWINIEPTSNFNLGWNLFLLCILIIQMAFVPLKICFFIEIHDELINFLLIQLPLYVYILEMILNFMTGYYEHGSLITDKVEIAKNYLKTNFLTDIISTFPLVITLLRKETEFMEFLVLLKIKRLILLTDTLEDIFNLRYRYATLIDVMRLLIQFLFLSHIFGCLWHYIAILEDQYGLSNSWLRAQGFDNDSWQLRFIASIYWSSITTLTIGYGDISPVTYIEQIYVIFIALLSSVVFAYTISNIGQIFSQLNEIQKIERYKMSLVQSFFMERGLNDKVLKNKVTKFFEYFVKIDHSKDHEQQILMNSLAPSLRHELNINLYYHNLRNSKLFTTTFSNEPRFIEQLCQSVDERQYTPGENIIQQNGEVQEIYFILKGEVELQIYMNNKTQGIFQCKLAKHLSYIKKNHVLGERFFITSEKPPYTAKALTFVRVAYIEKQKFQQLLNEYPDEYEKLQQSKNKILLEEQIKIQGCELCFQNHQVLQCPFVFYQPKIRHVIHRMDNLYQKRLYKSRKNIKSHHALKQKLDLQQDAICFAIENDLIREDSINDTTIRQLDITFFDPKALIKQTTSESSVNTLLQRNITSCVKESQDDSIDKVDRVYVRQGSNNQPQNQNNRNSMQKLNQLKLLRLSKKGEIKPQTIEVQDVSDSPGNQSKRKSLSSNFFTFISSVNVEKMLYYDFIKKFDREEILEFEKSKEFQYYYPNHNLQNVLDQITEAKLKRKRRRSKTRIQPMRKNNKLITSLRSISQRPRKSLLSSSQYQKEDLIPLPSST